MGLQTDPHGVSKYSIDLQTKKYQYVQKSVVFCNFNITYILKSKIFA